MRKYLVVIPIIALTMLASCNGGSDSGANSPSVTLDPFPLSIGSTWHYEYSKRTTTILTDRVAGTKTIDGSKVFVISREGAEHANYVRTEAEIFQLPLNNANAYSRAIGPRLILKLPLRAGDKWIQVNKSVPTGDGITTSEYTEVRVGQPEGVVTPAGYFAGAYPVYTVANSSISSVNSDFTLQSVYILTEWYVFGVGVVRREYRVENPSVFGGGTLEALSAYSITKNNP